MIETVVALLMIVNSEIKEHRIQESLSVCLKGKREAERTYSAGTRYQFIKSKAEDCGVIFAFTENLGSVLPSPLPASTKALQYSLTVLKLNLSREDSGILQP